MRQRPGDLGFLRLLGAALSLLVLAGCAAIPRPLDESASQSILDRLQDRKRLITSAAYRVRWRTKGTEPHGEFFLEIAYKAPERFRVSATGPFGIPAFTGVIRGDKFWFVDHRNGRLIEDDLANLGKYEIPLSSFFADYWRDLFAGGWGGTEVVAVLVPSPKRDVYDGRSGESHWSVAWDWHKAGPSRITLEQPGGKEPLICDLSFGQYSAATPFWQLERLEFRGLRTGGEHRWKVLKQDYNINIPDRFFEPLPPPQRTNPASRSNHFLIHVVRGRYPRTTWGATPNLDYMVLPPPLSGALFTRDSNLPTTRSM